MILSRGSVALRPALLRSWGELMVVVGGGAKAIIARKACRRAVAVMSCGDPGGAAGSPNLGTHSASTFRFSLRCPASARGSMRRVRPVRLCHQRAARAARADRGDLAIPGIVR